MRNVLILACNSFGVNTNGVGGPGFFGNGEVSIR